MKKNKTKIMSLSDVQMNALLRLKIGSVPVNKLNRHTLLSLREKGLVGINLFTGSLRYKKMDTDSIDELMKILTHLYNKGISYAESEQ